MANNLKNSYTECAQTQCYMNGDKNYNPNEVKKAFNMAANAELLASITINSAKKYYQEGNIDYTNIYKQGYTLASSWVFYLNVLNEYIPSVSNFDPISIRKYCALKDKIPAEINMQMNTWGDAEIFKIGVDLAKTALNKNKVSEVFTDKSVESNVKFIFTFWGVLQEYTYESIGNNKIYLYVESNINNKIDPYYEPNHPALPTLMWVEYPSVFYNQMSEIYDTDNTRNMNTEYKQINISDIQNLLVNLSNKTSSKNLNDILLKVSKNPNLIHDISELSNAKFLNISDQDKVNLITKIISQLKPIIGNGNNKGIIKVN